MKRFPIGLFFVSLFTTVLFLIVLKILRPFFPPPPITTSGIIGYAQYTGYPFYFDNLLFVVFITTPIFIILIYYVWKKKYEKN